MAYCPPVPTLDIPSVEKVPTSVLNYGFDLSPPANLPTLWSPPNQPVLIPWLAPGEEVVDLTVVLGPGSVSGTEDLTLVESQITANPAGVPASLLVAWVSGGLAGNTYLVTFSWTSNSTPVPRQDSRSMYIVCVATL